MTLKVKSEHLFRNEWSISLDFDSSKISYTPSNLKKSRHTKFLDVVVYVLPELSGSRPSWSRSPTSLLSMHAYAYSTRTKDKSESWINGLDCSPLQTYSRSRKRFGMVIGESSQPPVKDTTLTFQCLILTSTNYNYGGCVWKYFLEFMESGMCKEMSEPIKTRNLRVDHVKKARLQTLITEFKNLKMSDNNSVEAYCHTTTRAKTQGVTED
nr:hypothetical protein [Tanacetum cinerariifolium]